MAYDKGDETHTVINATIKTQIGRKTIRYLLVVIIGGGLLGGSAGFLLSPEQTCRHYENELVQWRHWAEDRSQQYPKTDRAGFWAGAPIYLEPWGTQE